MNAPVPPTAVTPYQPNGAIRPAAVANLLISLMLAAAIVGVAAYWLGKFIYLILIFPLGMGLLIGMAGKWMVKLYAIRNLKVCRTASLLAGLMTLFVFQYTGYLEARQLLAEEPWVDAVLEMEAYSAAERQLLWGGQFTEAEYQESLKIAKAVQSFPAYVALEAEHGVEISRTGSGFGGINLGEYGTWIYWIVEWMVIAWLCYITLRTQALAPYCDLTHTWMEPLEGFYLQNHPSEVFRAIETGNTIRMKRVAGTPPDGSLLVEWYQSPARDLAEKDMVSLTRFSLDNKGNPKHTHMATYEVDTFIADPFLAWLHGTPKAPASQNPTPPPETA